MLEKLKKQMFQLKKNLNGSTNFTFFFIFPLKRINIFSPFIDEKTNYL